MTFQKAKRKYAREEVDTVYHTVTTVVPRDSAILRIVTDTTTVVREIRQGRARIIYERTPRTTVVRADCDSVVIEKRVPVEVIKQVWGVDPKYERLARTWRIIALVLAGVLVLALVLVWFFRRFAVEVRRK